MEKIFALIGILCVTFGPLTIAAAFIDNDTMAGMKFITGATLLFAGLGCFGFAQMLETLKDIRDAVQRHPIPARDLAPADQN